MTRSSSDRQRALKWVLLVTVPRTVLDDAANLAMGPGNDATRLRTASVSQDQRKCLRTASVRQDQRQDCVLLESQLANGLRSSCAQTSCKECAALRQAARSALRSAGRKGSTRQERLESMLDSNRHHLALAGCCLVFVLLILIAPTRAQAHAVRGGPSLQANAGFETRYRHENWVPVQVTLHNNGPDFSGTLSLSASSFQYLGQSNPSTPSNYQMPISLANGARKQVTMYVPLYFDAQSVAVNLLDGSGNVIGSQAAML